MQNNHVGGMQTGCYLPEGVGHASSVCTWYNSKSRGQILRVAATMHVLFHLDTPLSISTTISVEVLKAAQDFVETSNQHVAYLAGRGDIAEAVDMFQELKEGLKYTYDLVRKCTLCYTKKAISVHFVSRLVVPPFPLLKACFSAK